MTVDLATTTPVEVALSPLSAILFENYLYDVVHADGFESEIVCAAEGGSGAQAIPVMPLGQLKLEGGERLVFTPRKKHPAEQAPPSRAEAAIRAAGAAGVVVRLKVRSAVAEVMGVQVGVGAGAEEAEWSFESDPSRMCVLMRVKLAP